jgi:hypothetical protein
VDFFDKKRRKEENGRIRSNAVIVNSLLEKQSGESVVKTNIRSMNPPKSTAEEGNV